MNPKRNHQKLEKEEKILTHVSLYMLFCERNMNVKILIIIFLAKKHGESSDSNEPFLKKNPSETTSNGRKNQNKCKKH